MNAKKEINEYLLVEYGFDSDADGQKVSDSWPFHLEFLGEYEIPGRMKTEVYQYNDDNESYYAIYGNSITFVPVADMSLEHLRLQECGSQWLNQNDPVDMSLVTIGITDMPPTSERKRQIVALAKKILGSNDDIEILEGLYLKEASKYFALVKSQNRVHFIAEPDLHIKDVPFEKAPFARRLAFAIGRLIESGYIS